MASPRTAPTTVPVHPLLADRWSPRAFSPRHAVTEAQTLTLLEAARWAPSAGNTQPWRFLVAHRGTPEFDRLFAVLAEGNRVWAGAASALVLLATETVDEAGQPRPYARYDAGQAAALLTVQARAEGIDVHQMGGFDAAAAAESFDLPPSISPVVVLTLGVHDAESVLPEPYASRESAPRERKPLAELLLAAQPAGAARTAA